MGGFQISWSRGFSNFSFVTFILFSILVLSDYLNYFQIFDDLKLVAPNTRCVSFQSAHAVLGVRQIWAGSDAAYLQMSVIATPWLVSLALL